ncbi:MAG: selenocysteine-specific translation elongation factor [Gammaproteobacteria bacterium]|nr:selenocysteine-specific translation elongation factor [Gammaproteobacteria bacterium]
MLIATAGHVDHGKSALIKALTGVETDRLEEERRRGLSIELGFAYRDLEDGGTLGFVDVPGHERFIHNMLAGMPAIDLAMLVVAADDGPMPQTREHLAIIDLLGVQSLIAVINKIDAVDAEQLDTARLALLELLAERGHGDARLFEVSALRGDGIAALEVFLLEQARAHRARAADGGFRLAIDRSFVLGGTGLVVTGAVFDGEVSVGDQLVLLPSGRGARVRGIRAQQQPAQTGRAGQRCALNIAGAGIETATVSRGMWLVAPETAQVSEAIEVELNLLEGESKPLRHWAPVHLHLGSSSVTARVGLLSTNVLEPGGQALARLVPSEPVHAVWGDRFVLRDASAQRTIGGGRVLNPNAPRSTRRRLQRAERVTAYAAADPRDALRQLLEQSELGVDLNTFARGRNLKSAQANALFESLPMHKVDTGRGSVAIAPSRWESWRGAILEGLELAHEQHPDEVGLKADRVALLADIPQNGEGRAIVQTLIRGLQAEGRVVSKAGFMALPAHRPVLDQVDQRWWKRVESFYAPAELQPAAAGDIAKTLNVDGKALGKFLDRAAARGLLVRVSPNRYLHPQALAELALAAQTLAADSEGGAFDARSYKEHTGIGRNLAIQVLEYFDTAGLTRRLGDKRALTGDPAALFGLPESTRQSA